MPFCKSCGSDYAWGDAACSHCGESFSNAAPLALEAVPAVVPVKSIRARRILAGGIDLAVSLVLCAPFLMSERFVLIVLPHLYLLLRDSFEGKSAGKVFAGLTVVDQKTRRISGPVGSILRNWCFSVPLVGPLILVPVAALQILCGGSNRIGGSFSETAVVADTELEDRL